MEKLVVFNDFANTASAFAAADGIPNYADILAYLSEGRLLIDAHAYVPIDPRNPSGRDRQIEVLWSEGFIVHTKVGAFKGDSYKCDFDVEITLDLMRTAEIVRPDIIVLMTGDKDFVPVILELRSRGIRVEVAAFPGRNAARELMLKASGFIDLGYFLEERQAQVTGCNEDPLCEDATGQGVAQASPIRSLPSRRQTGHGRFPPPIIPLNQSAPIERNTTWPSSTEDASIPSASAPASMAANWRASPAQATGVGRSSKRRARSRPSTSRATTAVTS